MKKMEAMTILIMCTLFLVIGCSQLLVEPITSDEGQGNVPIVATPKPKKPQNLRVDSIIGHPELKWDSARDSKVIGWEVWRADDSQVFSLVGLATNNVYTDATIPTFETRYTYKIRAFTRKEVKSSFSDATIITPFEVKDVPPKPTNLQIKTTTHNATLTWDEPGPGFTYNIYHRISVIQNFEFLIHVTNNFFVHEDLTENIYVYYEVKTKSPKTIESAQALSGVALLKSSTLKPTLNVKEDDVEFGSIDLTLVGDFDLDSLLLTAPDIGKVPLLLTGNVHYISEPNKRDWGFTGVTITSNYQLIPIPGDDNIGNVPISIFRTKIERKVP